MSALNFVPIAHNLHRVAFAGANMESIYNKKHLPVKVNA